MTDTTEQRLHDAAAAARRTAGTLDRGRMLARIEGDRSASRGWSLALAGAAVAAAVIGGVAVLGPDLGSPRVDPVATPTGSPTGDPSPTPSPTTEPSPAPSPTSSSPSGEGTCSAAGLSPDPEPQPELPAPVADLRADIAQLAVACDLEALAAVGGDDLEFSFGGGDDAAAHWRVLEEDTAEGAPRPMEALRLLLDTPPGRWETESAGPATYWAWPRLHTLDADAPQAERDAAIDEVVATGLHTRAEIEEMFELFGGYLGYRVVIEVPGHDGTPRWTAFVAGD